MTSCAKVLRYTQGMSFEEFVADERTFDAAIRNLFALDKSESLVQVVRSLCKMLLGLCITMEKLNLKFQREKLCYLLTKKS